MLCSLTQSCGLDHLFSCLQITSACVALCLPSSQKWHLQVQRVQAAGFEGSSPKRGPDEAATPSPGTLYAEVLQNPGELLLTFWSSVRLCNDLPFLLSCQVEGHQLDFDASACESTDILPGIEAPLTTSQTPNECLRLQLKASKVSQQERYIALSCTCG